MVGWRFSRGFLQSIVINNITIVTGSRGDTLVRRVTANEYVSMTLTRGRIRFSGHDIVRGACACNGMTCRVRRFARAWADVGHT